MIGDWLVARRSRDRVVLGTKVGARPRTPGDTTLDDVEGLSPKVIRAAIRSSLTRLLTDRVDIYWAHIDDRTVPLAETVGAFDELVRSGLAVTVGASNMVTWRMEEARATALAAGQTPYTAMQLRHTYIRPRPGARGSSRVQEYVTDDTLDYLSERPDVTLWAYSTLLSGAYHPCRPADRATLSAPGNGRAARGPGRGGRRTRREPESGRARVAHGRRDYADRWRVDAGTAG